MSDFRSPITLGIEMSNPGAHRPEDPQPHAVAMWNASGELLGSSRLPDILRGSDAILHAIAALARSYDVKPNAIGRIIVSIGPGGYTALRISTTSAKVLADTLGAELIAVPTARVVAICIEDWHRPAMIALASKKDWCRANLQATDGSLTDLGIVDASVLEKHEFRSIFADHHLPESFQERAAALGMKLVPLRLDARDLLRASQGIEPIDPLRCAPIYAREPDAVTQWRERSSG